MKLNERLVLQLVEGATEVGTADRLVLMDRHNGTEVVFDLPTAVRLSVGLAYFTSGAGRGEPTDVVASYVICNAELRAALVHVVDGCLGAAHIDDLSSLPESVAQHVAWAAAEAQRS